MAHRTINLDTLPRLPQFSHASITADTIYVAGTLGTVDMNFTLADGGAGPQTTQALQNIETILTACGASLSDVVKVSVFLRDMADFGEMNRAYGDFFGDEPPVRITVGGVQLALDAAVEIECIAGLP